MPTTVTQATASSSHVSTHTHQISLRGVSGYMFLLLIIGTIVYIISFSSTGWVIKEKTHEGLWESCICHKHWLSNTSWFQASQAMFTIGLISLLVACIAASIYMCIHSLNKNIVIIVITVCCFVAVFFMLIGLIVYGSNRSNMGLNWSFALATISAIMCLAAGVLAVVQLRSAGL